MTDESRHFTSYLSSPLEGTNEEDRRLTRAVVSFAQAMDKKLRHKREDGFVGWDNPANLPAIRAMLAEHVQRGDAQSVDIANLAMMIWWHTQREEPRAVQQTETDRGAGTSAAPETA